MSDWNLGRFVRIGVAYAVGIYTGNWQLLATQLVREKGSVDRNKAQRAALEEYNRSLTNRLEMVDLTPEQARTLVLGRVRYVEGVRARWTSGTHDEKLTLIVSFAGHEIDGFEQWYVNDVPVTLDANGWVQESPWSATSLEPRVASGVLDGSGNATLVLAAAPAAGTTPTATWATGAGDNLVQGAATLSITGTTATVTGPAGANVSISYEITTQATRLRIRPFLGQPGQNVGAALAAEYPGKITSDQRFAGMALAVVDLIYSTDAFPQGRPNITAVFRGAKCLDPRTGATSWTQNPALHAYHYARWGSGWALGVDSIRVADVIAAANVCDISTAFTLRKPGGSASVVTLPRYRSGIAIPSDADHAEAMDAIIAAMAGRTGWAGGVWRMRAGAIAPTVATVTEAWLAAETRGGGTSDDPSITAVQSAPREQRFNRITGRCVDPEQRYQVLPFPAVQDAVLVAAKGPRPLEVQFTAVDHIAHAQHLASIAIRQAQAGLRLEMVCGEEAGLLEIFDVVEVTLPKYGYTAKTFEVTGWEWQQGGAYRVQLAEITGALFSPLAELTGRDPAPDSDLRAPWEVEQISGVSVTSGTPAVTDSGSILTRTVISFSPAVGENIRQGGQIEVQYTEAAGPLPPGDWPSWPEAGTATRAIIPGLLAGRFYRFRVRAVQPLPLVRGPWSPTVTHQVDQPQLLGTAGIAPQAATTLTNDSHDFAGATFGTATARTVVVTPAVDCTIEFTASIYATNVVADSGNQLGWAVTPAGGAEISLGGAGVSTTQKQQVTTATAFDAAAGVALTFAIKTTRPGGNPNIGLFQSQMRITQIKR